MSRTYLNQFTPDFAVPEEIVKLVAAGKLEDTSWTNDICPSFCVPGNGGTRIWVDHPDPRERETRSPHRFVVALYDEIDSFLGTALATNRLSELLFYLRDHWAVAEDLPAPSDTVPA